MPCGGRTERPGFPGLLLSPHPGRLGAPFVAPRPAKVCAPAARGAARFARAFSGRLFAHFACCRPGSRGSPASARRARRRFAGAFRRIAPSLRSPRPPLAPCPPAPPLGLVRRCAAPAALAGGDCSLPCPCWAAGFLRSPLPCCGRGLAQRAARRGSPGAPASRLRGRLAPAPGACAALRAACLGPLAPGAFFLRARACAGLLWVAFFAGLSRARVRRRGRRRAACAARLTVRKK